MFIPLFHHEEDPICNLEQFEFQKKAAMRRLFGSKESNYGLLSAVLHDTQPNFPQVMHPQIRFLEVIGEDLFVFVFEKAIDSHRLVQGGVRFLEVADSKQKVSQIQAGCSDDRMPFGVRHAGAKTPGQMSFGLLPVVPHQMFPGGSQIREKRGSGNV